MANVKITALPSLTGAASHSLDVIPVVDVSADTTSKMTRAEFFLNVPAITTTGNMGVGTSTPQNYSGNLVVIPTVDPTTPVTAKQIVVGESSGNALYRLQVGYMNPAGGWTGSIQAYSGGAGAALAINADGGNVGIGTASPNAASIVDAQSTTKGVRFPNMTTTQKTAMANVAGNVVFDTTLGKLCVNSGSGWQTITSI